MIVIRVITNSSNTSTHNNNEHSNSSNSNTIPNNTSGVGHPDFATLPVGGGGGVGRPDGPAATRFRSWTGTHNDT